MFMYFHTIWCTDTCTCMFIQCGTHICTGMFTRYGTWTHVHVFHTIWCTDIYMNVYIIRPLTHVHVCVQTFSRKTGTASTTTAEDLGSASIIYVSARHALCIISKLCSICSSVMSAGTTCLTGNPANVSSLPITSNCNEK